MVSSFPYRAAIKKRTFRHLFLVSLLIFVTLSFTSQVNAQVATQSGYSLVGTIRSGDFSGAVIIVAKGEQSFFRLFEKLPDGSQVVKVRDDCISLKGSDGTLYDMYISHEKTIGSAAPPPASYNPPVNVSPPTPAAALTNAGSEYIPRSRRRIRHTSSEDE